MPNLGGTADSLRPSMGGIIFFVKIPQPLNQKNGGSI